MLLFELESEQTTIKIHEQEFDKDTLIKTFDSLKESWPFHLRVYQNKPLLDFLEKGETAFFQSPESWTDFDDLSFMVWVEPIFVERYREDFYKCCTVKGFQSLTKLKAMCDSEFPMPLTFQDQCFEKTYTFFNQLIEEAKRKYKNPVRRINRKKRTLIKGLDEYLSLHYLSAIRILPIQFFEIKNDYGRFAHSILYAGLYKGKFMTQFDVESLKMLKLSAKISAALINNKSAKDIQKDIQKVIEAKEMSNWEAFFIAALIYIIVFGTLYFLIHGN